MVLKKHRCLKFVTRLARRPTVQYGYYMYTGLDYLYCIKIKFVVSTDSHAIVHVQLYNSAENAIKLVKLSGLITETSTEETETSTRKNNEKRKTTPQLNTNSNKRKQLKFSVCALALYR